MSAVEPMAMRTDTAVPSDRRARRPLASSTTVTNGQTR